MKSLPMLRAFVFVLLPCTGADAAVLATLPTPGDQGGMLHANIWFDGTTLHSYFDPGIPELKPLSVWSPGNTLDPASPWYAKLDPTTGAAAFNSQYGLLLDGALTDPLPEGANIYVSIVAASPGIEIYRWRNAAPQMFDPILGTAGSASSWDWGALNHAMFHPMFVAVPGTGADPTATLRFELVDAATGAPLSQYGSTDAVFVFELIPEPSSAMLGVLGAFYLVCRRRRS